MLEELLEVLDAELEVLVESFSMSWLPCALCELPDELCCCSLDARLALDVESDSCAEVVELLRRRTPPLLPPPGSPMPPPGSSVPPP